MALFKILSNFDENNSPNNKTIADINTYHQGYCYFDKTTGKFWIDTTDTSQGRIAINGTFYGICNSAAETSEKIVNCNGFVLSTGAIIFVTFGITNTHIVSELRLNVNGTGPYGIRYKDNYLPSTDILQAGMTYGFVYDGTNYQLIGNLDSSSSYSNATTSTAGLMSAADKTKLDGISANARIGTVTSIQTGIGLTDGSNGNLTTSGTIKTKLKSETPLTAEAPNPENVTNRTYAVAVDSQGNLAVNVPWVDTNTTLTMNVTNEILSFS